jgi:hypothetical protein
MKIFKEQNNGLSSGRRRRANIKIVVFLSICYAANTALHVRFSTVGKICRCWSFDDYKELKKGSFRISKTYIFLYFLPVDGSTRLPPGLFFIEAWNPSPLHPGLYIMTGQKEGAMIKTSFLRKLRPNVQKCMQIDFKQLII